MTRKITHTQREAKEQIIHANQKGKFTKKFIQNENDFYSETIRAKILTFSFQSPNLKKMRYWFSK